MKHFRFNNPKMVEDIVDEKTKKVLCYKEINVIEVNEEAARKKAFRSKYDTGDQLSDDWELMNTYELGKEYQRA